MTEAERAVFVAAARLRRVSGGEFFRVHMLGLAYDDLEHARQMQLRFGRPGGERSQQLSVREERRAADRRRGTDAAIDR